MTLRRLTEAVQWLVGVGATTAVVLLFALEGAPSRPEPEEPTVAADAGEGAEIYALRCATCHGAAGQGGTGPRLAGTVEVNYPELADEIAVVTTGRNAMPAFGDTLTTDEIAAVVAHTRDL